MIIEIRYHNKIIKEVDVPFDNANGLEIRMKTNSNKAHKNIGKRYDKALPEIKAPQKQEVKIERPKAVYSNPRPYDF